MQTMKDIAIVAGKLTTAGVLLCGIGWVILTQDVTPQAEIEVAPARADIIDAVFKDGNEFTRAMASLGFAPRAYDMNGNVMYFASGYSEDKTPHEVMNIVQEQLVFYGVNSKNWLEHEPVAEQLAKHGEYQQIFDPTKPYDKEKFRKLENDGMSNAMLKGEVVPMRSDSNYIMMGGVTPNKDVGKIVKEYQNAGARSPIRDYLGGYRFIDATAEPGERRTMITAVWTDEDFDAKKMDNRAFKQQPADPNVPACVGCQREFRVQSLQENEPFRQNKWTAKNAGMDDTYSFYQRAMASRGWRESGVQQKLSKLAEFFPQIAQIPGRTLNLEKDGKNMTIVLLPAPDGGTQVYSNEQYDDAQTSFNVDEQH